MDEQNSCILCEKDLSQGETVTVSRGLDAIICSSLRRQDGIAEKLQGLTSVCVHVACRKNYTRESTIKSVLHPSPKKAVKSLRSSQIPFNFKTHCLFCAEECDVCADKKKPVEKRDTYEVRTSCKSSIINAANTRNDEWGQTVK